MLPTLPAGFMLGPYKIIQQLGQGGMATVYRARHVHTQQPAAVNSIQSRTDLAGNEARFGCCQRAMLGKMSRQVQPGSRLVVVLRVVKERWPNVQRVLLTGQADSTAIEEAVNQSEIFRFIWKPWDDGHLLITIQSAIDQFWTVEENARLHSLVGQRNDELERLNRDLDGKLAARSQALVRAAQEWRACFDAIGDPLAIMREGGCEVVRANAAFARAAGVAVNMLSALRCTDHAYGALPCPSRCLMPAAGCDRPRSSSA